eukprot:gnl/TRDRNA2_/TRDRNA2_155300_c0_seq1.p1 gnl/TRDRNA2_/TRDRNA2_155300_c0~~gnl/TRDRNA2_/TRDRNA2_155300_c0_seq1.p1  ORF type:complete len:546 (-),score=105.57 gnl/TRDRNA2_/TRDRNA2_155300_c0_seq1:125-1762(-)
MTTKILVCQNTACNNQGSSILVRDIEELARGQCDVEECACLGKCGKGPNVEVYTDGVPEIHIGIKTWQKVVELIEEKTEDLSVPPLAAKVGRIKYDARRNSDPSSQRQQIQNCIDTIGGEARAAKSEPRLLADLLVMRSKSLLQDDPLKALTDAKQAVELMPTWAQAHLALAAAHNATNDPRLALEAFQAALDIGKCINKKKVKRQLSQLEIKVKELKNGSKTDGPAAPLEENLLVQTAARPLSNKIYSQFGGRDKFFELAHGVHELLFEHPLTEQFFPPTMDNSRITVRNVDFLVGAFGGPKYKGPDMISVHEFLRITDEQYDIMLECYEKVLQKMKARAGHKQVIMSQLEGMRNTIVYQAARPNPLARTLPGYMEAHKAKMRAASRGAKAGASTKKVEKASGVQQDEASTRTTKQVPKSRAKSKPKRRSELEVQAVLPVTHESDCSEGDKKSMEDKKPQKTKDETAETCPFLSILSIDQSKLKNPHTDERGQAKTASRSESDRADAGATEGEEGLELLDDDVCGERWLEECLPPSSVTGYEVH